MNKDRTLQLSSDAARRLLELVCRPTAFALLTAAEHQPITRTDAASANGSTPESADLVLKRLREAHLLQTGPRRGRNVTYEITELAQQALALIRTFGGSLPPPRSGWWVTVKRGPTASSRAIGATLAEHRPTRLYRCLGDFDYIAALEEAEGAPELLDALFERLRESGVQQLAAAHFDLGNEM